MKRLTRLIKDDSGVAMITVIGIIALMTVVAIAAFTLAMQTIHTSTRINTDTQAFQAANSGVDVALARLNLNGYRTTDYPISGTDAEGNTYKVTVDLIDSTNYLCTSTGTEKSGATQAIKVKFELFDFRNITFGNSLGGSKGVRLVGNARFNGPLYLGGGINFSGDSQMTVGPLYINGGNITGSSHISNEVSIYCNGTVDGNRPYSTDVPNLTLPTLNQSDLNGKYTTAIAQSHDNLSGLNAIQVTLECTGGDANTYITMNPPSDNKTKWYGNGSIKSRLKCTATPANTSAYYKVVGNGGAAPAAVGMGNYTVTIGGTGSWGYWPGAGGSTSTAYHDDFAYDDVNSILYVEGTVFIDGGLIINKDITYVGNGTLVVNGPVTINGSIVPKTGNLKADLTHILGIASPSDITVNGTNQTLVGTFYTAGNFDMTKPNQTIWGNVLANDIVCESPNQKINFDPDLNSYLPADMPCIKDVSITESGWAR